MGNAGAPKLHGNELPEIYFYARVLRVSDYYGKRQKSKYLLDIDTKNVLIFFLFLPICFCSLSTTERMAPVAQGIEQRIPNPCVARSSRAGGTMYDLVIPIGSMFNRGPV